MKTSFCTIAFQKNKWGAGKTIEVPLTRILPILGQAGYDGVEIWADHWMLAGPSEQEQILARLAEHRLSVAMLSSYYNFTTSEETARQSMEHGRLILANARRLKSRGIRMFTGKTASKDATPEQWDRCARCLAELCDLAAADGIHLCLETHSWNLMDCVEGALRIVELVSRPNLKFIFQPSTFPLDQYMVALEALAPHIAHVHATNSRDKQKALLGEGDIDWPGVIAALRRIGFGGYISIEWFGDDPAGVAAKEATYLRSLLGGR